MKDTKNKMLHVPTKIYPNITSMMIRHIISFQSDQCFLHSVQCMFNFQILYEVYEG